MIKTVLRSNPMKSTILFTSLSFILINPNENLHFSPADQLLDERSFTDCTELKEFKSFSNQFFRAIKSRDTAFLNNHIVFPVPTHSFSNFDRSLETIKKIDSRTFFKKLSNLFPRDLLEEISQAEHSIFRNPNGKVEYTVTVYDDNSGVESNANWIFIKKQGEFYFTYFTAEAG